MRWVETALVGHPTLKGITLSGKGITKKTKGIMPNCKGVIGAAVGRRPLSRGLATTGRGAVGCAANCKP